MRSRGWGPFRQEWYSICSRHRDYAEDCNMCRCGHWVNVYAAAFSRLVFRIAPDFWRWWVNRGR